MNLVGFMNAERIIMKLKAESSIFRISEVEKVDLLATIHCETISSKDFFLKEKNRK